MAAALLLRRRTATTGLKELVEGHLGDIDAREVNTIELPGTRHRRARRPLRPLPRARRRTARRCRPTSRPTSSRAERAEEILAQGSQEQRARQRPGDRAADRRHVGPLRPVRDRGASRRRREAAHGVAVQDDVARDGHARRGAAAADAPARRSATSDGEEIVAANGRYGPYVKKGTETRSLETEEQLFTITLDEALALLAQPKQRGRGGAAPPLKELGRRPGQRQADRGEGRPLRPLRHRRRDQRQPARGRHDRGDHARAGGRARSRTAATAAPPRSASGRPGSARNRAATVLTTFRVRNRP